MKKDKILEVINVFETGSKSGNYSAISIFEDGPNDRRQITYGRSQTTEFGGLPDLIRKYEGGLYSDEFDCYLSRLGKFPSLCDNDEFITLLKKAGTDPVMRKTQDEFFDERYWKPALKWAKENGFQENLSMLVIYDSYIHSGGILSFLKEHVDGNVPAQGGKEKDWIISYVDVRGRWLKNHRREILRHTVYRTNLFKSLIADDNWDLSKEFKTQGVIFKADDDGLCLPSQKNIKRYYGEPQGTEHLAVFSFPTETEGVENKTGDLRGDYVIHNKLVDKMELALNELYDSLGAERYKKEGWNIFGGTYRNSDKLAVSIIFNPKKPETLSTQGIEIMEKHGFLSYGRSLANPKIQKSLFVAYIPPIEKGSHYDKFGLPVAECLKF